MMGDDYIRLTLLNRSLNELHQFQMRNRIHFYVRESTLINPVHTKELVGFIGIISKFLIGRSESTRLCLGAHNAHVNSVAFT